MPTFQLHSFPRLLRPVLRHQQSRLGRHLPRWRAQRGRLPPLRPVLRRCRRGSRDALPARSDSSDNRDKFEDYFDYDVYFDSSDIHLGDATACLRGSVRQAA
eukprot:3919406-Pyramimonas_sp.AAC.1